VETFRQAREAKAPVAGNVHDAGHAVRALVRGFPGGGDYSDYEFKVEVEPDVADDALEMLTWSESEGLTFKAEFRERSTGYQEEDDTTVEPESGIEELLSEENLWRTGGRVKALLFDWSPGAKKKCFSFAPRLCQVRGIMFPALRLSLILSTAFTPAAAQQSPAARPAPKPAPR
jgi:hypothetical protein